MDILAKPIHSGFVLTPTIIAGGITGYTLAGGGKTLTVPLDASVSGTNTGDNATNTSVASKTLDNLASVAMNAPLQWNNSAATSLDIASTAETTVGRALTVSAGSTIAGATIDIAGGNLTLASGLGKGTGASSIIFQTGRTLTTGSTLQTLTTAMTILGSGNVGIGTTTPGALLHISGTGDSAIFQGNAPAFVFKNVAGTQIGFFSAAESLFKVAGDLNNTGTIALSTRTGGTLYDRVTILNGGNVGIGTTAPGNLLTVVHNSGTIPAVADAVGGGINIARNKGSDVASGDPLGFVNFGGYSSNEMRMGSAAIGAIIQGTVSGGALPSALVFHTAPTGTRTALERMRIDKDGNVGIGTTAPTERLDLATNIQESTANIRLGTNTTDNSTGIIWKANWTTYTKISAAIKSIAEGNWFRQGLAFYTGNNSDTSTNASERMRIDMNGNVGIGTTAPLTLTEFQGGLTTVGAVLTLSSKETSTVENDILGRINFRAALDAAGTDAILTGASIAAIAENTFSTSVNETGLQFSTGASEAATEKVRIDHHGSIGVNTTAPVISGTGKLDMNADTFRLRTARTPASAGAAGNAGEICWDSGFLYVCTATNTWVRAAIITWV